jgi:hypothetical protein
MSGLFIVRRRLLLREIVRFSSNTETALNGITFIYLNIIDSYLTSIALSMGGTELNPFVITEWYGVIYKFFLSLLVVILLCKYRKEKLLSVLNVGMFLVVAWNTSQILLC